MTVRRSLLFALAFALVPLIALGLAASAIARDAARDDAAAEAERTARLAGGIVEQRLALAHAELAGIAEWPDLILPAIGVARGGDDAQRQAAGEALAQAELWWGPIEALTVHSTDGVVVTTERDAADRSDPGLVGEALAGQAVAGRWDDRTSVFQIAQPLVGSDGDAAVVALVDATVLTEPLRLSGLDLRLTSGDQILAGVSTAGGDSETSSLDVNGTPWTIEVTVPTASSGARGVMVATVLALIALACVLVVVVAHLGRSLSGRLRRLAATAEAIGEGRLDQRTGIHGDDELAKAAASFDRMADSLVTDISRRREMETLLVQQALHDPLTGLANRAKLIDRLGDALLRSSRSGAAVGLLFCDLDGFKAVNDELGHSAGDDLLMLVADRFRSSVRPSDTVARFGGDEFVVLCSDLRDPTDAVAVAERLKTAFEQPFQLGGTPVSTTSSIGIAVGAGGSAAPDDLLRRADQAMYQAKASGKARHVVYELTADEEEQGRAERAAEITKAIDRRELELYYQPVIALDDGGLVGYEAYVRWHHPSRGDVRPQELIDIATSAGLAADVDLWVLATALSELAPSRCDRGEPVPFAAVNLTPGSLATAGFAARVDEVLTTHEATPASVVLEVSEAALSGEPGTVLATLDELHDLGVGLAIDDFGTGHSSLDRLRRCPIDTIKIHQTLVHGVVADDDDRAAVQAIVSMAHALDLTVIAEGVETQDQQRVLAELGCPWAQGYHIASPAPVAELPLRPT